MDRKFRNVLLPWVVAGIAAKIGGDVFNAGFGSPQVVPVMQLGAQKPLGGNVSAAPCTPESGNPNLDGWHNSAVPFCWAVYYPDSWEYSKILVPGAPWYFTADYMDPSVLTTGGWVHVGLVGSFPNGIAFEYMSTGAPSTVAPWEVSIDPFLQPVSGPQPLPTPLPPTVAPHVRPLAPRVEPTVRFSPPAARPPTESWPWPRPPKKGEKETKKSVGPQVAARILDAVSEGIDAMEAIWKALPARFRTGRRNMPGDLYRHWDQIDWEQAAKNLLYNEVEDRVVGRIAGPMNRAFRKHGLSGVGWYKYAIR